VAASSPNFNFLAVHAPQLVSLGAMAKRYFRGDPNTALIKLRHFRETLAPVRRGHLVDRLDQSILGKAFAGELVPQNPTDEPTAVLLDRIKAARGDATAPRRKRRAEGR